MTEIKYFNITFSSDKNNREVLEGHACIIKDTTLIKKKSFLIAVFP